MQQQEIINRYHRWREGLSTPAETQQLFDALAQLNDSELESLVKAGWQASDIPSPLKQSDKLLMANNILKTWPAQNDREQQLTPATHRVHFLKTAWFRYAAAILILFGIYFKAIHKKYIQQSDVAQQTIDIPPGKDGAILTLADGSQVVLDSLDNGIIATQNGAKVLLKDGSLAYNPAGSAIDEMTYNTMTTPRGGQYQLTLADGTRVWLNAASSITYPTVFTGKERNISIIGEVYFEVAKKANIPFRVSVNDQVTVEVLGTHFNVNAYENENTINTTLLEGSVRVISLRAAQPVILKPGQQALIANRNSPSENTTTAKNDILVVNDADIEKAMAWKNGYFDFKKVKPEELFRQLERWYDIEVKYEKDIPIVALSGKMTRDISLNTLLPLLGEMGLKYRMEGRTLLILSSEKH